MGEDNEDLSHTSGKDNDDHELDIHTFSGTFKLICNLILLT